MLGAAFPFVPVPGTGGGGTPAPRLTWPNGYRYRWRNVITAAIHQMPSGGEGWVKYRFTDTALKSVANGGHVANDAAWPDIRFETGSGSLLEYELESWNASTGALVVYVHLTNFVADANYTVLINYGKTGITANEANPTGCWAGFAQAVDMATGIDRSGNGRHFTLTNVTAATLFDSHAGDFQPGSGGSGGGGPPPPTGGDDPLGVISVAPTFWSSLPGGSIIVPSSFAPKDVTTITSSNANRAYDFRGRVGFQHDSGMSRTSNFTMANNPANVGIFGGKVVGQQSDTLRWSLMKNGPAPGAGGDTSWDDKAVLIRNPGGNYYVEDFVSIKAMDPFGLPQDGPNSARAHFRGCYVYKSRDDAWQNDNLKQLTIEDCLVDGTHMGISQRPDADNPDKDTSNITVIRNCLFRLRRGAYGDSSHPCVTNSKFTGPFNSFTDDGMPYINNDNTAGYCNAWLWKGSNDGGTHFTSMTVDMSDCYILVEGRNLNSDTGCRWPAGTYSNVWVGYVGPGSWPYPNSGQTARPAGVTLITDKQYALDVWNTTRATWLAAHPSIDITETVAP